MSEDSDKYGNLVDLFARLKGGVYPIEGVIAVGKTTFGKSLEAFLNKIGLKTKFYQEYVDDKLLAQYISDMKKYAFSFQIFMFNKRLEIYHEAKEFAAKGGISFIDRSIIGDITFAQMQKDNGNFTDNEWNEYCITLGKVGDISPTACIYLQCSTETAMKRLCKRNCQVEVSGYTQEYMEQLQNAYKTVIGLCDDVKYVTINWDDDLSVVDGHLDSNEVIRILKLLL